jgi:hypothetical protein
VDVGTFEGTFIQRLSALILDVFHASLIGVEVVALFRNNHTHEVRVHWMRGKKSEADWVLAPGQVFFFS